MIGKGIALMFKEACPEDYEDYADACKRGDVLVGKMFVTERRALHGPHWIINFPTKKHWRGAAQLEWISAGLEDLRRVIMEKGIRSIAIPPLGTGNGGLEWRDVRPVIMKVLASLEDVDIFLFEPAREYQNVAKRAGVEKLTPARALVAELVRRYWVLGIDCSLLRGPETRLAAAAAIGAAGAQQRACSGVQGRQVRPLFRCAETSAQFARWKLSPLRATACRRASIRHHPIRRCEATARRGVPQERDREYLPALESATRLIDGFESPGHQAVRHDRLAAHSGSLRAERRLHQTWIGELAERSGTQTPILRRSTDLLRWSRSQAN